MARQRYTPTEAKYKGGATEMYVTYDHDASGRRPEVVRVYVPGKLINTDVGDFKNRYGRNVHGVRVRYEQERSGYIRASGARVASTRVPFTKFVEVPGAATNVHFRESLPEKYRETLQDVR